MSRFDTYLFDLDGTLIDSIDLILHCYRGTMEAHGVAAPAESLFIQGIGTPLRSQLAALCPDPERIEAMVETYRELNLAHHDRLVRRFPGVSEVVGALKQKGARLGVVTSKMRAGTLRGLSRCGLDGLFEVIVGADDVENHKPHPEPVLRALGALGADPGGAVFIGDSPHDLRAGKAAGVATAAALWGPFPREALAPCNPDYWLARPADIASLAAAVE